MVSMKLKSVLCLLLVAVFILHVNGMWAMFMQSLDLNNDGVIQGDAEIQLLRNNLIQTGETPDSAQQAIDSADTNYDGAIDADEYGEMRANMLM